MTIEHSAELPTTIEGWIDRAIEHYEARCASFRHWERERTAAVPIASLIEYHYRVAVSEGQASMAAGGIADAMCNHAMLGEPTSGIPYSFGAER